MKRTAGRNGKVPIVISSIVPWRRRRRIIGAFLPAFSTLSLAATDGFAQTDPPDRGAAAPQPQALAKQQAGDSVASRIGRLEQQFLELQVSVGTLETLLRAKPGAVLPQEPAGGGVDTASSAAVGDFTARVGALETQIGALSSQNRVPPIDRGLPQRSARQQRAILDRRELLCAWSVQERGGRLPQGLAACSTFGELSAKYPQAPAHILDQAKGERKKAGC